MFSAKGAAQASAWGSAHKDPIIHECSAESAIQCLKEMVSQVALYLVICQKAESPFQR